MTSNNVRTSDIVRAIGPTTPIQENAPTPAGRGPVAGILPGVGFKPQMPQKWPGTRIEPPPSLPTPPAEHPDAMAAASPLEPPALRDKSQGLLVFPLIKLSVSYAIRNSGVFVLPRRIAPAALKRATSVASASATYSLRSKEPAGQRHPATSIQLSSVVGKPNSGPAAPPRRSASSAR